MSIHYFHRCIRDHSGIAKADNYFTGLLEKKMQGFFDEIIVIMT